MAFTLGCGPAEVLAAFEDWYSQFMSSRMCPDSVGCAAGGEILKLADVHGTERFGRQRAEPLPSCKAQ
jgi:hypothetical protein